MLRWVTLTAVLAALYVLTGRLGFLIAIPPGNVTPVWPPSGIAWAVRCFSGNKFLFRSVQSVVRFTGIAPACCTLAASAGMGTGLGLAVGGTIEIKNRRQGGARAAVLLNAREKTKTLPSDLTVADVSAGGAGVA